MEFYDLLIEKGKEETNLDVDRVESYINAIDCGKTRYDNSKINTCKAN